MKYFLYFFVFLPTLLFAQQKGSFVDSRDGKKYGTVKIGTQTWMSENLNYEAKGSKCNSNEPANCQKYGRLYDWETAIKACPSGWYLPSDAEWQTLVDLATSTKKFGTLKSSSGWGRDNGTDDYGFSALPGGYGNPDGTFYKPGNYGYWWSATGAKYDASGAYGRSVVTRYLDGGKYYNDRVNLYSVRCIQGYIKSNTDNQKPEQVKKSLFTDTRDKKTYKTVKIGTQTWMAENLNYDAKGSKCYDNKSSNCQKYGRLYNWSTAKSACPSGWHLPSNTEWQTLVDFADGDDIAGKILKSSSDWKQPGNGTDVLGFSALPGGIGFLSDFDGVGNSSSWWSATASNGIRSYCRIYAVSLDNKAANGMNMGGDDKEDDKAYLFSVRCLQD